MFHDDRSRSVFIWTWHGSEGDVVVRGGASLCYEGFEKVLHCDGFDLLQVEAVASR